ncbi:hypothetical protein D9M71_687690 [compost metagenome]
MTGDGHECIRHQRINAPGLGFENFGIGRQGQYQVVVLGGRFIDDSQLPNDWNCVLIVCEI